MKALAVAAWALAGLLVTAAFLAFLAACWAHGDDASRWVGTGFVTVLAGGLLAAAGAAAWDNHQ